MLSPVTFARRFSLPESQLDLYARLEYKMESTPESRSIYTVRDGTWKGLQRH